MQTNPAVEQNKNIKWFESPWNQSRGRVKGLWRKWFAEKVCLGREFFLPSQRMVWKSIASSPSYGWGKIPAITFFAHLMLCILKHIWIGYTEFRVKSWDRTQ